MRGTRWRWTLAGFATLLVAAGAAAAWRPADGGGSPRYVAVPTVVLPMPTPPPQAAPPASPEAEDPPPTPSRLGAAEPAALADLPPPDPCARPCVAAAVTGLGLAAEPTARALALPAAVGLSFSPYAADLAAWAGRARSEGHELLLDLPLQPERYPEDDAGPLTLLATGPALGTERTLAELLDGRAEWLGAVAGAGAFAAEPGRFAPIAAALAARGLAFVEVDGGKLGGVARAGDLAYARAGRPAEGSGSGGVAAAVDKALAAAEAEARRAGRAAVALPPVPVALDRLAAWIGGLPGKGVALVPASAVLAKGAAGRRQAAAAASPP